MVINEQIEEYNYLSLRRFFAPADFVGLRLYSHAIWVHLEKRLSGKRNFLSNVLLFLIIFFLCDKAMPIQSDPVLATLLSLHSQFCHILNTNAW